MLPAHRWKRSLQHNKCSGDANGAVYPRQTNTCLPIFTFYELRGRRGNVALFYNTLSKKQLTLLAHCWKRSLQVYCPHVALLKEATFLTAIKLLIAVGSFVACADGERGTPQSCMSIGSYNALL